VLYPTELRARATDIAALRRPCQRRGCLGLLLAVAAAGARAGEAAVLERASPVPALRLGDGTLVALAGIVVPAELGTEAAAALTSWLDHGAFEVRTVDPALDRYRRTRVALTRVGGTLQAVLVAAGLALVAPEPGIGAELLPLEAAARARRRGVWAAGGSGPFDARDVPMTEGRYVLVEGRIARTAPTSIYWYANFGELYRRDFTVRIPKAEERAFVAAGLDLAGLGGRRVRVRGWLFEENGPMIEITHPLALEVLE
jgi:micrococcal nuclease